MGGPLATKYGRLPAMRATTLPFVVGPLASALATNISVMCFGRLLSGIGAGASTVICPLYIAEICPRDKKGLYGASTQVMINVGILLAQILGYFLSYGNIWRMILAVSGLIGALELIGLHFVPESPKWLADNANMAMVREVLRKIRRESEVEAEIAGTYPISHRNQDDDEKKDWKSLAGHEHEPLLGGHVTTEIEPPHEPSVTLIDAIRVSKCRRAVIAVVAAMIAQQATGINSVIMYSVAILGAIMPSAAALITVMVSGLNMVVTLACAPLADKIGRKTCLLASIVGMGMSSFLLALAMIYNLGFLSVIATFSFVASFGVGLGPVPFILASELVGPEGVEATQCWGLAACWTATFCVAQFFPVLNAALPNGNVFWVFVGIAILIGSFIAWWLPESKGKVSAAEVWADA